VRQKPGEEPDDEDDGYGEDESQRRQHDGEKNPVAPSVAAGLTEVALQKAIVAAVGLESDVEYVSEDGNGADQNPDAEIGGHPRQGDIGNAARPGSEWNDGRKQAGQHVAQTGDEANEAVNSKAEACARDGEGLVEKDFQALDGAVAKEPRATVPAIGGFSRLGRGRAVAHGWTLFRGGHLGLETARNTFFNATIVRVHGGYSSVAERLSVAQDVEGSIPSSRPNKIEDLSDFVFPPRDSEQHTRVGHRLRKKIKLVVRRPNRVLSAWKNLDRE
jgi:hypothetical protein